MTALQCQTYYDKFFPYALLMQWITYNAMKGIERTYDKRREFVFVSGEGRWTRYLSISGVSHWHSMVTQMSPARMEIGAVYPVGQVSKTFLQSITVVPEAKELVFDIDVTDYEDVRTQCPCKDKQICQKCWIFLACAIGVLDHVLKEHFGFKHMLYVFSGRRGVHCWVCDIEAHSLTEQARKGIVSYFKEWESNATVLGDGHIQKLLKRAHALYYGEEASSEALADQITQQMAPRLDEEVTRKMSHAIKLPFCVHPSTGNVCVPIEPALAYEFNLGDSSSVCNVKNIDTQEFEAGMAAATQSFQQNFLQPLRRAYAMRAESDSASENSTDYSSGVSDSDLSSDEESDSYGSSSTSSSSSYYSEDEDEGDDDDDDEDEKRL